MTTTILLAALLAASGNPAFAPAENWRAAVLAGDGHALAQLYLKDAQGAVQGSGGALQPEDDVAFWAGMKRAGISVTDPKILEVTRMGNKAKVILRVLGTQDGAPV